jgi:hypothetical protein
MSQSKTDIYKPLAGAVVAIAADKYILKQDNMTRSLYFGAAVAGALYASQIVNPMMPNVLGVILKDNGKGIEDRAVEIIAGSASAYAVNKYVLNNDYNPFDMKRIGIIAAADFAGEYFSDYMNNRALNYFS